MKHSSCAACASGKMAALFALTFALACSPSGDLASPGASTTGSDAGLTDGASAQLPFSDAPPFAPAVGMLRRLTRLQFRNALRDLLVGTRVDISQLDIDDWTGDFAVIGASVVSTSNQGVERFHAAIENAVNTVFADPAKLSQLIGCTPTGAANDTCVKGYLQSLGLLAWRRPLEAAEVDRLGAVATKAATELGSPVEGARWATVALLSSPNFLYRPELGAADAKGAFRLSGYEMASRLAFLIWNSLPDKALLEQAASGALDTREGIRAAATRLLEAANGREAVGAFAEEFMRLDKVLTQAKDPGLFPEYTPTLQEAMVRDMRETWATVAFDDGASALDLFTTTKVVVNSELAKLYGLETTGLSASVFQTRTLPSEGPRIGILSKAGFLSQWANQKEGSPTLRGKSMREALMCLGVPPPPPDVAPIFEDPPAGMRQTKRQRLEMHRTKPACAGCHALMDPLGLPFENFDGIGRYRTTDDTLPIDSSGEFNGRRVNDARALGQAIAADPKVAECLVRKFYSYSVGHRERDVDGTVLNTLVASFQASGFKFRQLVLDIVTSEAFSAVAPQL